MSDKILTYFSKLITKTIIFIRSYKVTCNNFSNFWQPLSPITCVAWNAKVQHILGTLIGLPSGTQAVIWDLRKNEPIIKIQDRSARLMSSTMSWNPLEPTQFALGCEGSGYENFWVREKWGFCWKTFLEKGIFVESFLTFWGFSSEVLPWKRVFRGIFLKFLCFFVGSFAKVQTKNPISTF